MTRPKYRVCPKCGGEGKIVNPVLSVWTQSDREENPEAFEDMLAGVYDVSCPMCKGLRVVTSADSKRFQEEEEDRRTSLYESGIYPGNPDFY